ncbi:hypothetical protein SMICM17S_05873 [Streptomyces microflavus]
MPPRLGLPSVSCGADELSETAERQPVRPSPSSRALPPPASRVERRESPVDGDGEGYSSVIEACL